MKNKLSLSIIAASMLALLPAKAESGKIVYEEKTKLDLRLGADQQALMKDMPKEHTVSKQLLFNPEASLFTKLENSNAGDDEIAKENEGGKMVIKMDQPDNKIYCDLVEKKRIEQRDFMSRLFLIEVPFSASSWKLTGKQKTILNYTCQEAILQDTARKVTAWFTSAIPVSTGPNGVCNLPGLVLAAEFNDGEKTFEAKSISLEGVDSKLIVRPKEGKKVTREEFNAIVKEKTKEMQEQGEGDGNVIIRIKH